jgi:glycosyltransferase involved in cell wall biosynthesis
MARRDGAARTQVEEQTMTTPTAPALAPADTAPAAPIAHTLSLVLPAHNEAGNLEWVVRAALAALPLVFRDCEIVVVDDGSRDATPAIADALAVADARVRVIHHPRNQGYGAALRSGFAAARGDRIMFMDADRQFDIREVAKLAPWVDEYGIVAGYRLRRRDPWRRVALGATFNLLVRVLFGVRVRDIDCGFKIFRADLLHALDLQAPGALINTEILALAHRQGAALVEIGVNHYPRPAGEQSGGSPRVVLRALDETMRLWWRLRAGPPAGVARPHIGAEAGEQPR